MPDLSSFEDISAPTPNRNLMLAALGVVFGDIGTSPLYAVRQSLIEFGGSGPDVVTGVLSLIVWSLAIVVTVKYVIVIMRADNRGEGGLLALTALALRTTERGKRAHLWIMAAGLVGAALFYGDGVITPAISVLSAVEGLKVATPVLQPDVVPISIVLLIGLFLVQNKGTAAVGSLFGPAMLVWFLVLAALGVWGILHHPRILFALDPLYGIELVAASPWRGFFMLGAVFLAVTGAETLYADMGHFGRPALRRAWLGLVFPALLLNYFGQGAMLLSNPGAVENPFYHLAPAWGLYPLVVLATVATIIASQAVISGAFSITRQAIQLGYLPRTEVRHTSETEIGQVYVPYINAGLLIVVVLLVLGFRSSDALGAAYGIAVSGMMAITTGLAFIYMRSRGWSFGVAAALFGTFWLIDLTFLSANLLKITEGGWFPVTLAVVVFAIMSTWWNGRRRLAAQRLRETLPLEQFLASLEPGKIERVPGTSVFLTRNLEQVPLALLHALKHYKVLHERVVLMLVGTEDVPHVPEPQRLQIAELGKGFFTIRIRYGFMDHPNVLRALALCRLQHFHFNLMETSFFIGREKILSRPNKPVFRRWRDRLFIMLSNLALDATEFFRIPANRVVELGGQIEI